MINILISFRYIQFQIHTAEQIKDVIQKYNIYVITNVTDITHLIKAILKQPNTSFKLPKREWNHLIIHITEIF